jgi:hypothetical protein
VILRFPPGVLISTSQRSVDMSYRVDCIIAEVMIFKLNAST